MDIFVSNGYSKKTDLACPKCAIDKLGKRERNLVQIIQDRELESDKPEDMVRGAHTKENIHNAASMKSKLTSTYVAQGVSMF